MLTSRMASITESSPMRNKSVFAFSRVESSSQKRARADPNQYQFAAFLLGRAHGDDEPHPTPHFPLSQNSHGMAHRLDFKGKSKDRGIQIPKQAIRNRGFLFEQLLELTHIDFRAADHFEPVNNASGWRELRGR